MSAPCPSAWAISSASIDDSVRSSPRPFQSPASPSSPRRSGNPPALTCRQSRSRSSASALIWSTSTCEPQPRPPRRQPVRKPAQDPLRHRQHGQPPQRPVGLAIIGVGGVARQAEQHRRHSEGQSDLARRRRLQPDEIHVRRRQAHRLPFQPALEQQRPPGIVRAGKLRLHLGAQPLELLARKPAPSPGS